MQLDGYRIAHLSDLHIGSFASMRRGLSWAKRVNRLNPDLIAITGDLVTNGTDFYREVACIVRAMHARDGVVVSPGNHDYFGDGPWLFELLAKNGATVLRNQHFVVERGGARLVVAGVDDVWTRRADLERALHGRPRGTVTVLLAHDPDLFLAAAREGVELVLSGHTHGGQVGVPLLTRWLNLSKLSHRFHLGLYRSGDSVLYVSAGLGTTGPPIRLGAAPEIAIVQLEARPARQG